MQIKACEVQTEERLAPQVNSFERLTSGVSSHLSCEISAKVHSGPLGIKLLSDDTEPKRQHCAEKQCLSGASEELVKEVILLSWWWPPDVAPEEQPDANEY
jgi:hypothetical protein